MRLEKEQKNTIVLSIRLGSLGGSGGGVEGGTLLSCCPFRVEISASKALEARMRRRSTVSQLEGRNILKHNNDDKDKDKDVASRLEAKLKATDRPKRPKEPPSPPSEEILVNKGYGWLQKKGHVRHNWKRRFFVLTTVLPSLSSSSSSTAKGASDKDNFRLIYFSKAVPNPLYSWPTQAKFGKGVVLLVGATLSDRPSKSATCPTGSTHRDGTHRDPAIRDELTFVVEQRGGEKYELCAGTQEEKRAWMEDIRIGIEAAGEREKRGGGWDGDDGHSN